MAPEMVPQKIGVVWPKGACVLLCMGEVNQLHTGALLSRMEPLFLTFADGGRTIMSQGMTLYSVVLYSEHLRIWASKIYALVQRRSCRRNDRVSMALPGMFMGFHGTDRVSIYLDSGNRVRYTDHAVVDKLHVDLEPSARPPAAQFLHGLDTPVDPREALMTAIDELDLTPDQWKHGSLSSHCIPDLTPDGALGLVLQYNGNYGRCEVSNVVPDSPAALCLTKSKVKNQFLLALNGVTVRTYESVLEAVASFHNLDIALDGITILLGKPGPGDDAPEDSMFFPVAGNAMRAAWSVLTEPAHLQCPHHWSSAMKSPFRAEWLQGLLQASRQLHWIWNLRFPYCSS